MRSSTIFNVLGLIVGVVAAGLMYCFPPRIQLYTEDGQSIVTWLSNPREEKKYIGKWQVRLSKLGPLLLGAAFLLQMVGAFLSEG